MLVVLTKRLNYGICNLFFSWEYVLMYESDFIFLDEEFSDIYEYCLEVEDYIKRHEYKVALSTARDTIEFTIKEIFSIESKYSGNKKLKYPNDLKSGIAILSRKNILEPAISKQFQEIRVVGNFYSHDNKNSKNVKRDKSPQEDAFNIHHKLFNVLVAFYNEYSNNISPRNVGRYSGIRWEDNSNMSNFDEKFDSLANKIDEINRSINNQYSSKNNEGDFISGVNINENFNEQTSFEVSNDDWIKKYEFYPIGGSYLLGGLNKLKTSSAETVESSDSLSEFKKYLHIKRSIENHFFNRLVKVQNNDKCHLIMLCGIAGDGKSHLISYLNENHSDLMKKFSIINDATESDSIDETCIDTLAYKLQSFNDSNIDTSDEKLILSINLGILNNFIQSDIAKQNFSKLIKLIKELNIFDADDFTNNFENDIVSVISFSDYYIFEFDEEHIGNVKSKYLLDLFSKITSKDDENPFYKAYCEDKKNNANNLILKNYEFLCMDVVQETIITNIIKIIIKYKLIISTRDLFNFIYQIIVPSNISNLSDVDNIIYIEYLLPNLLFGSNDRCNILKMINLEDPVLKRSEITDKLLVDLNTGLKLEPLLNKYMDIENISIFNDIFDFNAEFTNYSVSDKLLISNTILRFLNIFGKEVVKKVFTKQTYLDYITYLYYYNHGEAKQLKKLIENIKGSILGWRGSLPNDYVCIKRLDKFVIGKSLIIDFSGLSFCIGDEINRFKTSMVLKFKIHGSDNDFVNLNIDYMLYEMIIKLNNGYKPNNSEQKSLVLFSEFIDKLVSLDYFNECVICKIDENLCFNFKFVESFDEYLFKRVV